MKTETVRLKSARCELTLHRCDCVEGMRRLVAPGSVDAVVTSPPYNVGVKYSKYDDTVSREEYLDWLDGWAVAVKETLSDAGSLFLNVGSVPSDPWVPFQVVGVMGRHFKLQNVIHWVKAISIEKSDTGDYPGLAGDLSVGHYKPVNSPRFLNDCHEYVFHLTKTGRVEIDRLALGVPYRDKSNVRRWKSAARDLRCRGNVWFVPYETIQSRADERPHPATFPVKLAAMCLKLAGLSKIRLAMDPFLGIGHAAVAAAQLGVNFVGFEIDAGYFKRAGENLKTAIRPANE
jgi:site-specific DNA-methyltransferase (adenine-specific)